MSTIEIRCPNTFSRLFMKLQLSGGEPTITDGNLMEFACADCRKTLRWQGENVSQVFHRYNFLGDLVETEVMH